MNLMRSSLYCFFQGGIIVQHTSLMSLKTIGCTSLFSLIHTASKIWRICLTALTALSNTLNGKIQNYPMTFMSMRSMQTTSVIKKQSKPGSPYTSLFGSNINKTNCFLFYFLFPYFDPNKALKDSKYKVYCNVNLKNKKIKKTKNKLWVLYEFFGPATAVCSKCYSNRGKVHLLQSIFNCRLKHIWCSRKYLGQQNKIKSVCVSDVNAAVCIGGLEFLIVSGQQKSWKNTTRSQWEENTITRGIL